MTEWEPEFAPWDGRRVPVTLLGGYLGAGKTTLLNGLLAATDRPIAVFVNDVGQINIDAALVQARHSNTVELTDGCICCSLTRGLADAFTELRTRSVAPDHLVIELSGVADPRQVEPWAGTIGFVLDAVVILIDADQFLDFESNDALAAMLHTQIKAADMLILTKTDLATSTRVGQTSRRLAELAPDTPVVVSQGPTTGAELVRLGGRRPGGVAELPMPGLFDPHVATTVALPRPTTRDQLDDLLADLGPKVIRVKGVAVLGDGTRLLIQVVGKRRCVNELPMAEAQEPTDLVVISVA